MLYLILNDSLDDYANIVGYVEGTKEDAEKFCNDYNRKCKHKWNEVWYEEIVKLNQRGSISK